jgi:hypothetical protein
MERHRYDLSHFSAVSGAIGRLQTLTNVPIVAGDSVSVNTASVVRLSSLRRNLTLDVKVDTFAFFVPYRHVYGDDWIDFIKQGTDETVTLTVGPNHAKERYLGTKLKNAGAAVPLWLPAGYNRIWNRYFRAPSDVSGIVADNYLTGTDASNEGQFGFLCGRLKTPWSTGIDPTTDASDREVTVTASKLDVVDLGKVRARYASEQHRDYFGQFYTDILEHGWGGRANPDSDERPYLLMRNGGWLSGYDVDGTDDASLGSFAGKSAGVHGMRVPRRYFGEHGTLWIMALLRFPTVFHDERHYLVDKSQPSYLEIAGDPELVCAEPPATITSLDWFANGSAAHNLGTAPYGQWYRYHPSYVHAKFEALLGFPFTLGHPTSADEARYFENKEFAAAFQTEQLGQWNMISKINIDVQRVVPPAIKSIYAGGPTQIGGRHV